MDKNTAAQHWGPSDIMDNGQIGICTGDGRIIVGTDLRLSWESAQRICDAHNAAIDALREEQT